MPHIGVDIGGTKIKVGIADSDGKLLLQDTIDTQPARSSRIIIDSILAAIDDLLLHASMTRRDVESIGVGVPGTAEASTGVVVYAPNLDWKNVRIVGQIRSLYNIPVYLVQDTRAAAWAEYLIGAGRGLRSVAAVTLGTGIGCGLVLDGKIYHGAFNTAGEFGHQIVAPGGAQCNCGRRGCLEAYAGGLGILREAKRAIPELGRSLGKVESEVEVADVFRLAEQGNPEACVLIERTVQYIGMGLVNLINLCSVELIALSGGISNASHTLLLDPLTKFVRENAYVAISDRVQVCNSALGKDAPLAGAALLNRNGVGAA
jgi:glucokinase